MKYLLLLLLSLCFPAHAVVRDFCKCDSGAQSGCTATSPSAPTQAEINVRAVGDVDRYCEGGSWLNPTHWQNIYNSVATGTRPFATPITLVSKYTASWGGGGVKPLFTRTASSGNLMNFGEFGTAYSDGGYIIQDAKFVGEDVDGTAGRAINLSNDGSTTFTIGTQHTTIQRMEITGFQVALTSSSGGIYRYIKVLNNNFHHNWGTGTLVGHMADTLIENNDISYNNLTCTIANCGFEHGLYWSHITRTVFRNNRFVDNSRLSAGAGDCAGGNFTMHGVNTDVVIEDNKIIQTGSTLGGCYGFSITPAYGVGEGSEQWARLVVRRNTVVNVGVGYHINSAPNAVIENNTFINTTTFASSGFTYGTFAKGAEDVADTGAIFRNNSFYDSQSTGGTAFASNPTSNNSVTPANVVVANNIAWFGPSTTGTRTCFINGDISTYTAHNYNICYNGSRYSPTYANHGAANTAGFDTWTTTLDDDDPLFAATPTSVNNWNLNIQTTSPAKAAGSSTYCARLTKTGRVRTGTCTIGAYQFGLDP